MQLMQRIVFKDWLQLSYEEKYKQIAALQELRTQSLEQSRLVTKTKKVLTPSVVSKKRSKDPIKDLQKTLDSMPPEVRAALLKQLTK